MRLAVCFTNFGPYHLARLRALGQALDRRGDRLIAYEVAGIERRYPWRVETDAEPFDRTCLFPGTELESIAAADCRRAIRETLDRDRPDALGIVGYARPESMAMLAWSEREPVPTVLMSESQEIDRPRAWWKEAIKRGRVRRFSAALVGGPSHARYLTRLGMSGDRIRLGYNAVDNERFGRLTDAARRSPDGRSGHPAAPYFLAISRFVPEKNLVGLVAAYVRYRGWTTSRPWDLVLCGGGPGAGEVDRAAEASGFGRSIHRPGFLQVDGLARWLAHAGAFVHPSLSEPWGLAINEAAAAGLPLLVSDRAGAAPTLVPDPPGTTGARFDPTSVDAIASALGWVASLPEVDRIAIGHRARETVREWGPARFASGMLEALDRAIAEEARRARRRSVVEVGR